MRQRIGWITALIAAAIVFAIIVTWATSVMWPEEPTQQEQKQP